MKFKKIAAFVISMALVGGSMMCSYTNGIFKTDTVSAIGLVAYELDVTLEDYTIKIPKGTELNKFCLENNGIKITNIIGLAHDMQTDPEYGKITKSNMTKRVPIDDCKITFPKDVKEGKNIIAFRYVYPNEPYVSSTEITVDVVFCDEADAENVQNPAVTEANPNIYDIVTVATTPSVTKAPEKSTLSDISTPLVTKTPIDDPDEKSPQVTQEPIGAGDEVDKNTNVSFELTSSVVQPGKTTYLDIDISENTGFCAMFIEFIYDKDVLTLESLSALDEFTGDDYFFDYSIANNKLIFMNNCRDNMKQWDSSIIRVAFSVNSDAAEGDYSIEMVKGDSDGIVSLDKKGNLCTPNAGFKPGKITVSKTLTPKTNVVAMSLGRVYATFDKAKSANKLGDVSGDGKINAFDAIRFAQYLIGNEEKIKNADTNEDGKINVVDFLKLKNYIIGG